MILDSFINGPGIPRNGIYFVGDQKFYYKTDAMKYASVVKKEITWDFNKSIFSAQAKKPRLNVDVADLYKIRAQQLRDKYDYLILAYSGGVDSHTILQTFINNKIKLDEVWMDLPFKFYEKSDYVLTQTLDATNNLLEWQLVIKPELDKLNASNPEIKIHTADASASVELEDAEDSWTFTNIPMQYHQVKRNRYLYNYIKPMIEAGKRVAVIMGIDKCIPSTTKEEYGFMFTDNTAWTRQEYFEYFYWTPDMPELVVTQAHYLWDHIKLNIESYKARARAYRKIPNAWRYRQLSFDNLIVDVTYPDWDKSKFQTNKHSPIWGENFVHLYAKKHAGERFYQSWQTNFKETVSKLDRTICFADSTDAKSDIKALTNFHAIGKHDGSFHPF